jgi:hypothetical protein
VNAAFRRFDRLRATLVQALASDAVLDRCNDLSYGKALSSRPDSTGFRAYLFPWEEQVIDRFFPSSPARILVDGAGGGREVFALAERGYEVVAFQDGAAAHPGALGFCTRYWKSCDCRLSLLWNRWSRAARTTGPSSEAWAGGPFLR